MKQRGTVSINNILIIVITLMFISTMPLSCYADPINVVEIEKIDQQYSDNNDKLMGITNQGGSVFNNYLGQSFIPSQPILSSIELYIFAAYDLSIRTGGMNLTLYKAKLNGYPDLSNPILEIKESRDDFIGHGFGWYMFDFPDTQVEPGETYFIRVDASRGFSWKTSYMKSDGTYDDYPNGSGWSFLMYDDYGYGDKPDFFFRTYYPYEAMVPVADAGQDQEIDYNERAFFSGNNSYDSDGTIVSYRWNFGDGTTGEGISIGHKYNKSGTYRIKLTVTDNDGLVDSDYCSVIVKEAPNKRPVPIIEFGGYLGHYYNLPDTHPDIEGDITGVEIGDSPFNHDWYDDEYYSFTRLDPDLTFGANFFPLNEGLQGDPLYFTVHWETTIEALYSGNFTFDIGSDDDSWVYIDDEMVCDLGGVHGMDISTHSVEIEKGVHELDIYFAERHKTQSGFYFEFRYTDMNPHVNASNLEESVQFLSDVPYSFRAVNSYDPDGFIVNYSWSFGDGSALFGSDIEHTLFDTGEMTLILNVTDNRGGAMAQSVEFIVISSELSNAEPVLHTDYFSEEVFINEDENLENLPRSSASGSVEVLGIKVPVGLIVFCIVLFILGYISFIYRKT